MDLRTLQAELGYRFQNEALLSLALTHPSYTLREASEDNQRLEFLGDAVLQLCVSQALYHRHPEMKEGRLTRRRAALVCEANLAELARQLHLGECLLINYGEEQLGGRNNPSILGDAMEAVLAAVWIDGGFDAAYSLVNRLMGDYNPKVKTERDAKSELQEYLQGRGEAAPSYEIIAQNGPPHARTFTARAIREDGSEMGRGSGPRKQIAEEKAAYEAVCLLKGCGNASKEKGLERNLTSCD